jgi:hypothetical protein
LGAETLNCGSNDTRGRAAPPGVYRSDSTGSRICHEDRDTVRHLDGDGAGWIVGDHGVGWRPAPARERMAIVMSRHGHDRAAVYLLRPEETVRADADRTSHERPAGPGSRSPQLELPVREEMVSDCGQAWRVEYLAPRT